MDEYLITDRSNRRSGAKNKCTLNILKASISKWCLPCLGVLVFISLIVVLLGIWDFTLSSTTSMLLMGLLASSMALWLCYLRCDLKGRNTQFLGHIGLDSDVHFWFATGLLVTQSHSLQASVLIIVLASLINKSLFDVHLSKTKSSGLFLIGNFILLCTSLLGDPSALLLMSLGLTFLAFKLVQASESIGQYLKPRLSSSRSTYSTSLTEKQTHEIERFILNMPMGVIEWNNKRQLVNINPAAAKIFQPSFGYDCLLGSYIDQLITSRQIVLIPHAEFDQLLYKTMPSDMAQQNMMREAQVICKWAEFDRVDRTGKICGGVACIENVTDQVNMILKIKHHAYFDLLTGLPNRHRLAEDMSRVLSSVQRTNNYCALLFIDLDHFKEVNDRWGHNHGDAILEAFAQRLRKVIRSQETVARLGGDEFVAVVEGLGTCREKAKIHVAQIAAKIIATAKKEFIVGSNVSRIGCSIGITLFNDASLNGKDLLGRADHALYRIKRSGRCNYIFDETKALPNRGIPLRELQFQH